MKFVYRISYIVYSLFLICLFTAHLEAAVVTSEDLLKNAEKYDAEIVIFKGEVIGDIMIRNDFAWINVRDEFGAIGVFCPKDLVSEIKYQGSYKFKGDVVSLRGVFNRACSQHGGDTDIHAEKITIIEEGREILHSLQPQKVKASIILLAIAFVLAILHLVIRRFR